MMFFKLLLSGALIYIAAMAIPNSTNKDCKNCEILKTVQNLQHLKYSLLNVQPLHYKLFLLLGDNFFNGEVTITIYIIQATYYISFHAPPSMKLIELKLTQIKSEEIYKIKSNFHRKNIVEFSFFDMLLPNIYTLHIKFEIPFNEVHFSWYRTQEGERKWLFATDIQSRRKQIFPSWNKPELRSTFDISIMHDRRYNALSNMPIQASNPAKIFKDMVWTNFQKTSLISIDNVALIVSDLNQITNLAETISIWCRPQLTPYVKFALFIIENVTMYLDNYWSNSKRVLEWTLLSTEWKVDHVAIPDFQGEVRQTLGFIFYREADIIYNEELDHITRKIIIARLIVREMARKYFGNLLNPSYWFHLWLNEGFNMFLQTYIMDKALPDFRMMDLFVVQIQHDMLDLNTYFVINSAIEYNNYSENYFQSSISYIKGSIIWRMLERTLPTDVFSKGINKYLNNQFSYPKATASDNLWAAMETVISASDLEYQLDVKRIMDSWAMQNCFPVLKVIRNYFSDIVTISIQFNHELDEKQYYVPVTYTTESDPNFNITWSDVWLTSSDSKIEFFLEKDEWIILNLQQAGYYRVNYDIENWRKIARYLNSAEYSTIHVLNRAQIIDDAFHFAIEKKLDFFVFWELANYLSKETDYIAWYPMIKALEFISNIFVFMKFYPELEKVQESLKFIEPQLTYSEASTLLYTNDDNVKCLKEELAKWDCIIKAIPCNRMANYQLQWHLEDPKENKLSPGWKRWTYCNGLIEARPDIWNAAFRIYEETFDNTILECLICSKNSTIIIDFLERKLSTILTLHLSTPYHIQQFQPEQLERAKKRINALTAYIFLSTLARNTKHMFNDILKNFEKIKHGRVSKIAALTVIINNIYSKEQLTEINKFAKHEMIEPISHVELKITTRLSEIERQTEYLQSLFSRRKN